MKAYFKRKENYKLKRRTINEEKKVFNLKNIKELRINCFMIQEKERDLNRDREKNLDNINSCS